ncbi:hypothetical protein K3722_07395 [Leisingera caerulea]|uniref:Uncharacterized protein n=1 Tax=Leisingera caerulea TaxID=506591 RepID=A0ABY5X028_LEICA|nr:hypothetical protein [Leisingera caerulea]UWQ59946.1 hypothetical protein K3722_07395 [Leisingera caerulea]
MALKHIETIECLTEEGTIEIVDVFQNFKTHRPLSGPSSEVAGRKEMHLRSGGPVNFIDENTFKVVLTGQTLRRA